jgi:hypothetical protein
MKSSCVVVTVAATVVPALPAIVTTSVDVKSVPVSRTSAPPPTPMPVLPTCGPPIACTPVTTGAAFTWKSGPLTAARKRSTSSTG